MPRTLSFRIGLGFAVLALATWISVGAALFLVLRNLHSDATSATLIDVATPLMAQVRTRVAAGVDVRTALLDVRDQLVESGDSVYLVTAGGQILAIQGDPIPSDSVQISAATTRGETAHGTFRGSDGQNQAWASVALRNPGGVGPRAVVLTTPDRSGADALRDLLAALPAVVIVTLVVGIPITWFISRSVTEPLHRLAAATADLPRGTSPELPLEGPTEVRELTGRFNAMSAELQWTRRGETELLANLRHDLRTPVTVIAGFAEALIDGTATGDDIGRAARAIGEEADRLESLVGELGAFERLEAGEDGLRPEPIVAADALRQTAERFGPQAAADGLSIIVLGAVRGPGTSAEPGAAPGEAPGDAIVLTADRVAVDRMLANLTANALAAFGPKPGSGAAADPTAPAAPTARAATAEGAATGSAALVRGHVWLSARRLAAATLANGLIGPAIALEVTDDGPGFAPGTTDRIFERFYRADAARAGAGSGLGLAIVRDLARAHGGDAVAENVAPRGARVSVVLPAVPLVPGARSGGAGRPTG